VEDHKRYHVPAGTAWHGLIGEGRQLASLNETKELLAGDIGVCPVRHHDSEVSGELETQAAAAMWMQKNSELIWQAREREKVDEKQSPEPALDARF
jgi:hypothetical protein